MLPLFCVFFRSVVLGVGPSALLIMLGKHAVKEAKPSPCFTVYFETESCQIAQIGLELVTLPLQPLEVLGSQANTSIL